VLEATVAQKRNADVAIEVFDVAEIFKKVLDDPAQYGFKAATTCGNSDECIWRDILHPTTAMHKVIAADVAKFLTKGEDTSPEIS
jgi:phospholipase/lecithinase/hemolysin